jgi:hypothetical protein
MGRWPLLALPVVTVAVVALAVLTAAAPRPFRVGRVWGGPTDGGRLSLRVEIADVVESGGEALERAVAGETIAVRLSSGRFEAVRTVTSDGEGAAEVALDVRPALEPLVAGVSLGGMDLALGRIALDTARWASAARRRGGWFSARAGGYDVRVAPERGALAVPFEEGLWVEIARGGAPVAGATVELTATGGRVVPLKAATDARGRVRFSVTPEEHTLGVRVVVAEANVRSEIAFGLPVVPGALRARLVGGELVIEAPVPRDVAYYALVTEEGRLTGGRVTLAPDAAGHFIARVPMPALPVLPTHAVVATQRDLRSAAAVGWPLAPREGEPMTTFDAADALLLDGRARGAAHESARRARVTWATVAFCAVAVLLELALLLSHARARDRELDAHLAHQGVEADDAERLAPARSASVFFAIAAIALGFLLLAIAAVLRLR